MKRLPIKGRGLSAIIRDTTAGNGEPETVVDKSEVEALNKKMDQAAADHEKALMELKAALEEKESVVKSQEDEIEAIKEVLGEETYNNGGREIILDTLKAKAGDFEKNDNLLDAFYLYRKIIRIDPGNVHALFQLASIYYSADIPKKAAMLLRAVLEIDPANEEAAGSLEEIENEY